MIGMDSGCGTRNITLFNIVLNSTHNAKKKKIKLQDQSIRTDKHEIR
jgi:hypothetical protein